MGEHAEGCPDAFALRPQLTLQAGRGERGSRGRPSGYLKLVPGWAAELAPGQLQVACDLAELGSRAGGTVETETEGALYGAWRSTLRAHPYWGINSCCGSPLENVEQP